MDDTKQRIEGERRGEAGDGFRCRARAVEHDEQVRAVAGRVEERSLTHPGRRLRRPGPPSGQVERLPGCDGRTLDETAEHIRALEPLEGIAIMRLNRGVERLRDLARGPGRLAAALRIDRSLDAIDLCREGPLWLGQGDDGLVEIGHSIRIGISRDANRLLRFYRRGSPFVSGPRSLNE